MAESTRLPDDTLEDLARQATQRLVVTQDVPAPHFSLEALSDSPLSPSSEVRTGETFEVWRVTPAMVKRYAGTGEDLVRFAEWTGRFHHQLKLVGGGRAYARSKSSGGDPSRLALREIVTSPLAGKIDRGVRWADRHLDQVPDDMLARLLVAPLYQVVALWFVYRTALEDRSGESKVLVVSASGVSGLPLLRLLISREFIERLSRERIGRGLAVGAAAPPPDQPPDPSA